MPELEPSVIVFQFLFVPLTGIGTSQETLLVFPLLGTGSSMVRPSMTLMLALFQWSAQLAAPNDRWG
jgi:hypothetical protein